MSNLLRKYKSLYSSTANSFGTGTSETITPASVVGLPATGEITLTFDRVASDGVTKTPSKMERIIGTISGGNFVVRTSPSSGRGADGSTEQVHTSPVVEMIWNAADWNDHIDHHLVEHNDDGTHKSTMTLPNTVATLTGTQTLTNKTLTSPKINEDVALTATATELNRKSVSIQITDHATSCTTGDGKAVLNIPSNLNGYNLTAVAASVTTAPTGAALNIQVRNVTDSADMLSTALTIDATETTSATAATAAVIDASHDDVATNDIIAIDVDAVGSTIAGTGLAVRLEFVKA